VTHRFWRKPVPLAAGPEFTTFRIVGTDTAPPALYVMSTDTFRADAGFASAVGLPAGRRAHGHPGSTVGP
jgi:hypothetical protein